MSALLEVKDLHVAYGAIAALKGISFSVERGQIVTLIGANGAGKTTLLRTISGLLRPRRGEISYWDSDDIGKVSSSCSLSSLAPHLIVRHGVAHVPEGRIVFANLSVRENLQMGAYTRTDADGIKADWDWVLQLFPRLSERLKQSAGTLSGGEQQMLAIGRALMSRPRLILMDEPSLGLSPILVQTVFAAIRQINANGATILLVEQNAHMALTTAQIGFVMETGTIALSGPCHELLRSDDVRRTYLGES
ncbi:MAG: ABC transporter ATP-binding protein [candidate division Zixibacteria bacterium]|nr:ABC transporter ATP-binding protein [candidate division Zixibacteria bacterium]